MTKRSVGAAALARDQRAIGHGSHIDVPKGRFLIYFVGLASGPTSRCAGGVGSGGGQVGRVRLAQATSSLTPVAGVARLPFLGHCARTSAPCHAPCPRGGPSPASPAPLSCVPRRDERQKWRRTAPPIILFAPPAGLPPAGSCSGARSRRVGPGSGEIAVAARAARAAACAADSPLARAGASATPTRPPRSRTSPLGGRGGAPRGSGEQGGDAAAPRVPALAGAHLAPRISSRIPPVAHWGRPKGRAGSNPAGGPQPQWLRRRQQQRRRRPCPPRTRPITAAPRRPPEHLLAPFLDVAGAQVDAYGRAGQLLRVGGVGRRVRSYLVSIAHISRPSMHVSPTISIDALPATGGGRGVRASSGVYSGYKILF